MRKWLRRLAVWIIGPLIYKFLARLRILIRSAVDESINTNLVAATLDLRLSFDSSLAAMGLLTTRLERLQLGVDVLRAEYQHARHEHAALINAMRADYQKSLGEHVASIDRISAAQIEHFKVSTLMLSRADTLLQRAAVPLGAELLMRTPEGFLLVPSEDNALVSSMWESGGRLEPGTLIVLDAILDKGDCVIDIGANIGLISLPAARYVGSNGNIIAIEPSSRVAGLLRRSLALNGLSDVVTLHQCAIGEQGGTATLNIGQIVGHSSLLPLPGSQGHEEVEVRRLDDLIEPRTKVRLVKIDAEGFEPQIWRGMQRIVADNPGIIVVVELGPEHLRRGNISIDDWLDMFLAPGFTAYEIDEIDGSISLLRARDDIEQVVSLNLLLMRQPISAFSALNLK